MVLLDVFAVLRRTFTLLAAAWALAAMPLPPTILITADFIIAAGNLQAAALNQKSRQLAPGRVINSLNGSASHQHLSGSLLLGHSLIIYEPHHLEFLHS